MRKGLGSGVDLIVVPASGKAGQFGYILRQPGGVARQKYQAVFKPCRLGMEAHDFVCAWWRLVWGDGKNVFGLQFLNQLRSPGTNGLSAQKGILIFAPLTGDN